MFNLGRIGNPISRNIGKGYSPNLASTSTYINEMLGNTSKF